MKRPDCWFALVILALLIGVPVGFSAAYITLHQQTIVFEGRPWVVLGGNSRVSVRNPSGEREYDLFVEGGVLCRDHRPFYWGRQGFLSRIEQRVTDEDRRFYAVYRQRL